MELKSLSAKTRTTGTKGAAHSARREGSVPAVLYGGGKDAASISVCTRDFDKLLHAAGGTHPIVQLAFDGESDLSGPALVKAVQRHPVKGSLLHADFLRIRMDERIETSVTVVLTGQAKGVLEGGLVEHQLRELEIECLALDVPAHIDVDVSGLGVGDVIHVSQIAAPAGVTILTDGEMPVASVVLPRAAAAQAETEAEGAAEAAPEAAAKKA